MTNKKPTKGKKSFGGYLTIRSDKSHITVSIHMYLTADTVKEAFDKMYRRYKERKSITPSIYIVSISVSEITRWKLEPDTIKDNDRYYEETWESLK